MVHLGAYLKIETALLQTMTANARQSEAKRLSSILSWRTGSQQNPKLQLNCLFEKNTPQFFQLVSQFQNIIRRNLPDHVTGF